MTLKNGRCIIPEAFVCYTGQALILNAPSLSIDNQSMSEVSGNRRKPWLACVLSLVGGPIGHVYCGRPKRALVFWTIGMLIGPLVAFSWVTFRLGPVGILTSIGFAISFPIVQAFDATRIAWNSKDVALGRLQRWWIYIAIFLIAYVSNLGNALFIKAYIAEVFMVPTRAMAPTIQAGDRIIVDKLWTRPGSLRLMDIVVYQSVKDRSQMHVMRVVGLPGDAITVEGARTVVDGSEIRIPEAHTDGTIFSRYVPEQLKKYSLNSIQPDSFFVAGDNRNMAYDSRFVGAIPDSHLHGTVVNILWSRTMSFPDPADTTNYTLGPIDWSRTGRSLRSDRN